MADKIGEAVSPATKERLSHHRTIGTFGSAVSGAKLRGLDRAKTAFPWHRSVRGQRLRDNLAP